LKESNKRYVGHKTIIKASVVCFRLFVFFFYSDAGFSWYTTTASQIPRKIPDVWRLQPASVSSTAQTNDSVVSEHRVRILNKLKTRGKET